ncbi:hypothetical protein [Actinoplanes regularis]|uniref:hypothetical protein n=1 Tax=Actinoplanes regularis TaxID=52697 RepID=UPI002553A9C8|nr:hypothetical protein [Actinoplanes regularis]
MRQKSRSSRGTWHLPQTLLTRGRRRVAAAGLLVAVVAGITTWTLWPDPEPRQREYLDATACLLTDQNGVTKEPATSVWTTMQQISTTTLVRVQNLSVAGPQTAANAEGFANSLTGGQCQVIIAVGDSQITAATKVAGMNPQARFITIDGGTAPPRTFRSSALRPPATCRTPSQQSSPNWPKSHLDAHGEFPPL